MMNLTESACACARVRPMKVFLQGVITFTEVKLCGVCLMFSALILNSTDSADCQKGSA